MPGKDAIDLTTCDREPIHLIGAIQPTGFLIAVSADWTVRRITDNAHQWLDRSAEDVLGKPLESVFDIEACHAIRGRLQVAYGQETVERLFRLPLWVGGAPFDVAAHILGNDIVLECEPSDRDDADAAALVRAMLGRLQRIETLQDQLREAVRQVRGLTGYDRVMIYRFHEDGVGEVVAESVRSGVEEYMGLRYPASDIPKQARALYVRNWLRSIGDVDAAPARIRSRAGLENEPLDLSMSVLRSVSPVHVEYLRNMGVVSSLSVSILRNGSLWGLIACHHLEPRHLSMERRTAAELFGQMFSLILESRERQEELQHETAVRAMHNRLMAAVAERASPIENIAAFADDFFRMLDCDGIASCLNGVITLRGTTPTEAECTGLVRWLNDTAGGQIQATDCLGRVHPPGKEFVDRAAGMLAIPLSRTPRDYLLFFRGELRRAVRWAGNPEKPADAVNGKISPRTSFAVWHETVGGCGKPWRDFDLRIAETIRVSMMEVILRLTDAAERDRRTATERQELLIAELNHRVRNILGLIRGLVNRSQGDANNVEQFASIVGGRIQALARAHDQITADHWNPAPLRTLIMAEAAAYLGLKAERVRLEGPDVLLSPIALSTLALVVHELMTNSAKYGALADSAGHIAVNWNLDPMGRLVIQWLERGGPPVQAPKRRGFGTTIIERSIPHDLRGEAEVVYALPGVEARLVIPASYIASVSAAPAPVKSEAVAVAEPLRLSGRALLVEDNIIIALDAEDMLQRMGARAVDVASSVFQALRIIEGGRPDVAVLDVNLGSETSFAVADKLIALGVPFIFATGYGEEDRLPESYRRFPLVRKPYSGDAIARALDDCARRLGGSG